MAAVYLVEEGSLLQTNLESSCSENHDAAAQAQCTGSEISEDLNLEKAAAERDLRACGPEPEAREHEEEEEEVEETVVNDAVPPIKIKEEQIEDSEYITVRLNVAGDDSDEQTERSANLSGVDESTDVSLHILRCQDCGQQFTCWETFKIHLREHVKKKVKIEAECMKRPFASTDIENSGLHVEKKMRMGIEKVNRVHHKSTFESNSQIKPYEIFIVHSRAMLSEEGRPRRNRDKKVYVCSVCGKMYAYPETFRNHQKTHLGQKEAFGEFCCKECGKCFARSAGLAVHMRYHKVDHLEEPTSFHCEQCNKNFLTAHTFMAHQEMHKQDFWCHKCTKGFKSREALDRHLLWHDREKHTCHICHRSFRLLSALRYHFSVHTSAKTYTCSTCFETFSQLGNLLTHRKKHLEMSKDERELPRLCRKRARFKEGGVSVMKKLTTGGANVMDKHAGNAESPAEDTNEESDTGSSSSSESSGSSASTGMSDSPDSLVDSSTHSSDDSSDDSSADLSVNSSDDSSTDSLADSSSGSSADSSADSAAVSLVDSSADSSTESSTDSSAGEHEEEPTDVDEIEEGVKGLRELEPEEEWECYECGACFVKEPELHMHYMKHASGEI